MPDYSVISGTGLNPDADAGLRQLTSGRNADAGLTFFRHLHMGHKSNTSSNLRFPLPAVWTCSGYPFHHHQRQQYGRALVQGVSISTTSSMGVQGVSLYAASCMDVQGVSLSTTSSMDLQGVSLSTAISMDMQGVPLSRVYVSFSPF